MTFHLARGYVGTNKSVDLKQSNIFVKVFENASYKMLFIFIHKLQSSDESVNHV